MKKAKSVLLSIVWTMAILIFPVSSGVISTVLKLSQIQIFLTQGCFMLISLVIPFVYVCRMKISAKSIGISKTEQDSVKIALYFLPLTLAELPLLLVGVDFKTFTHTMALAFFALAVALSEEIYFRGIILQLLRDSFSIKQSIAISAIVFGIGHFASVFTGSNIIAVALQIINAMIFGLIAAQLIIITKSVFPVICWHFIFNFVNYITIASGINEIIVISVQVTIMIVYAVYLWTKLPLKHLESERAYATANIQITGD